MSTYYLISLGLISFVLYTSFLSCSSVFLPINPVDYNEYDRYPSLINNDEENLKILLPNDLSFNRNQRSSLYYPRPNRNTWFRVSTYQQFKPSASAETPNSDNLMRWGR